MIYYFNTYQQNIFSSLICLNICFFSNEIYASLQSISSVFQVSSVQPAERVKKKTEFCSCRGVLQTLFSSFRLNFFAVFLHVDELCLSFAVKTFIFPKHTGFSASSLFAVANCMVFIVVSAPFLTDCGCFLCSCNCYICEIVL